MAVPYQDSKKKLSVKICHNLLLPEQICKLLDSFLWFPDDFADIKVGIKTVFVLKTWQAVPLVGEKLPLGLSHGPLDEEMYV